jgi:hypothetical protein
MCIYINKYIYIHIYRPEKHYDTTDFTVLEQHAKSDEKASATVLYEAAIKLLDPISSGILFYLILSYFILFYLIHKLLCCMCIV